MSNIIISTGDIKQDHEIIDVVFSLILVEEKP